MHRVIYLLSVALCCKSATGLSAEREIQTLDGPWDIVFDVRNEGHHAV